MANPLTQQELLIACRFLELKLAKDLSKQDVIKARNAKLKGVHPDHGGEGGGSDYFTRQIYDATKMLLEWIAQGRPDLSETAGTRPHGSTERQAPPEPEPPPRPQQEEPRSEANDKTNRTAHTNEPPSRAVGSDFGRFIAYYRTRFIVVACLGIAAFMLMKQNYLQINLPVNLGPAKSTMPAVTPLERNIKPVVESVDGHMFYTYKGVPDDFRPPSLAQLYTGAPTNVIIERDNLIPGALLQQGAHAFKFFDWLPRTPPSDTIVQWASTYRTNLINLMEQHAMLLVCNYQDFKGSYEKELVFWFQTRPDKADPAYLNGIHPGERAASIGKPRTDCPATLPEAVAAGGYAR